MYEGIGNENGKWTCMNRIIISSVMRTTLKRESVEVKPTESPHTEMFQARMKEGTLRSERVAGKATPSRK